MCYTFSIRFSEGGPRGSFEAVISNAVRAYGEIILVEPLMRKHYAGRDGWRLINFF